MTLIQINKKDELKVFEILVDNCAFRCFTGREKDTIEYSIDPRIENTILGKFMKANIKFTLK